VTFGALTFHLFPEDTNSTAMLGPLRMQLELVHGPTPKSVRASKRIELLRTGSTKSPSRSLMAQSSSSSTLTTRAAASSVKQLSRNEMKIYHGLVENESRFDVLGDFTNVSLGPLVSR